jgi:hypothetical protein
LEELRNGKEKLAETSEEGQGLLRTVEPMKKMMKTIPEECGDNLWCIVSILTYPYLLTIHDHVHISLDVV